MNYSSKARLLLAGAALVTLSGPAFALEGNDVLAKINAAMAAQGGAQLSAKSVDTSGSDVTLSGTELISGTGDNQKKIPVGKVAFEGVEEANGGYTIETVTFDDLSVRQEQATITATDISLSGVTVPGNPTAGTMDAVMLYDEAKVGAVNVSVDGKTALSVGETTVSTTVSDDDSAVEFEVEVAGIKGDLNLVQDPQSKDVINQLGVNQLDGSMKMLGSWELQPGTIDIEEYSFDFANVGRLNLAFSFSGYTLDFMKSAQATAAAMEANPNKAEAQQASSLAMLGLLQRLTFNSAQIRFDDSGITNKALDYAGKSQGVSGEQMAQMLKGMAPLVLSQYNMPALQNMLTAALNTYLDKPGNITVTAEPAQAVPFPMIMGAAMGAPNTIPDVLGVKVTAND